ncbi:hypothetical protein HD554DRAFT_161788 [Boletus coccyginus]|nr:hypothetical protein HD554DRAFT_161788 [Boletus coccyginus]
MAYRDPYAEQYTDAPAFNPYNNPQPHQAYDQGAHDSYGTGGYRDDAGYGKSTNPGGSAFAPGHYKSESTTQYDQGTFARATIGNRPRDLSHWRHERHGGLWTKGSRGACIGRFCCCTLMMIVFLLVGILLPLALWTRPPNIIVGDIQATSNGSELLSNGVEINLEIPFNVSNPNYFSVSFSSITANIYYPINNTLVGGGQMNDVTFGSHSNTNFTFPFSIEYTSTMPSNVISDVLSKCGIVGGVTSDITVNYDITLALNVLFFTVSPTISDSASFKCPLTASDVSNLTSTLLGTL